MNEGLGIPGRHMFKTIKELILASASPRRQAYLQSLGITFKACPAEIDERVRNGEEPADYVQRMALEKAECVSCANPSVWVLSADTAVILGQKILGKPASPAAAEEMLMELSGREHLVITGYVLMNLEARRCFADSTSTRVMFESIDSATVSAYVATGEPMDKAGAYGIQGKGAMLVRSIEGSYSNVVGLPLAEIISLLKKHEIISCTGQGAGTTGLSF